MTTESNSDRRISESCLNKTQQILASVELLLQNKPNLQEALDTLQKLREQEKIIRETAVELTKANHDLNDPKDLDNLLQKIQNQKQKIKNYVKKLMKNENRMNSDNNANSNQNSLLLSPNTDKNQNQPSNEKSRAKCDSVGPSSPQLPINHNQSHQYQPLPYKEREISSQTVSLQKRTITMSSFQFQ
jgi:hypothetical protein